MKINVTRWHILKGQPKDAGFCPVALAIKENVADDFVMVTAITATIGDDLWHSKGYSLPKEVKEFINNYDKRNWFRRLFIKPFSFEFDYK